MPKDALHILGTEIPLGGNAVLNIEVAKLHTRTPVKVPVIVRRAKKSGPVVLLMAGVHGDEINGVGIVREIIRRKYNRPTKGTVICIPVFNIFGFLIQTREFPDGRDLNRMFPGSKNGSLASQFAAKFTQDIIPHIDYCIDFHTGGAERENAPQVRCVFTEEHTLELSKVFNAPYLIHSNYINKSIREAVHKAGKTMLLFEGGKSKELDPNVINCGVTGTLNVLKHLGMQSGKPEILNKTVTLEKSKWLRAPTSGLCRVNIETGSYVEKRQVLGIIEDPFGDFERKVYAPFSGHVFGVNTSPIVNKGDALFHISVSS